MLQRELAMLAVGRPDLGNHATRRSTLPSTFPSLENLKSPPVLQPRPTSLPSLIAGWDGGSPHPVPDLCR